MRFLSLGKEKKFGNLQQQFDDSLSALYVCLSACLYALKSIFLVCFSLFCPSASLYVNISVSFSMCIFSLHLYFFSFYFFIFIKLICTLPAFYMSLKLKSSHRDFAFPEGILKLSQTCPHEYSQQGICLQDRIESDFRTAPSLQHVSV